MALLGDCWIFSFKPLIKNALKFKLGLILKCKNMIWVSYHNEQRFAFGLMKTQRIVWGLI